MEKYIYISLLLGGELNSHLAMIDNRANELFERLVKQMANRQGITEERKIQNQMSWVGAMNNICNAAEEIVNSETIYA